MKDYFTRLFNYDCFASNLLLQTIIKVGQPEKAVQLMAHLLAAQQIWLSRCKKEPANGGALWPDWKADTFYAIINGNHASWTQFISELQPGDFEGIIHYKNSKGITYENKLTDLLAHVINHGTHHRAQAGQQLKLAGVEKLPLTDYLFYIRD